MELMENKSSGTILKRMNDCNLFEIRAVFQGHFCWYQTGFLSSPPIALLPIDFIRFTDSMERMSAPLSFSDVSFSGLPDGLTCHFPSGSTTLVVAAREQQVSSLARLISGLSRPRQGSLLIDGQDLAGFDHDQLYDHRCRTAIVPANGGLISNLKLWENLTLPLQYHRDGATPEEERRAQEYLETFGYHGNLMALPAHLSHHEKRIVALARAFLCNPRIVVYCDCFEGVSLPHLPLMIRQTTGFHKARTDRVSIYVTTTTVLAPELAPDSILHLQDTPAIA